MFSDPIFRGYASIEFDFGKSAFHGNLNMFINALGIIKGVGPDGRAVTADIHFDPEKWYIYIGTPNQPGGPRTTCGTVISILDLLESRSESYFCIGSIVPPSPPLPQEVRSIAYKLKDNPSLRQSGAGLIFGASRQIKMDIAIAGIIDAKIEAKFGYDVMLRKYDGFVCQSDGPLDGQPIGLNGWYAAGQAYAYIYGELKVFGVNVASAGIAAALQARLPNPFYAQAVVGLRLKIGFIKVKKSLSLELGNDNCTLVSDNPGSEIGMVVIVGMTPLDQDGDVETIMVPEASLALGLDRDYSMASITNGVNYQYRVELNEATLTRAESGVNIPVEIRLLNDNTLIRMKPLVEMPGGDSVTFTVKLDVFRDNQYLSTEEKSVTFMTAERMDYIPEANVEAAYPADGMYNFYKEEYALQEGFIQLETGQPQLLTQVPYGYNQRVRLTSSTGEEQYISYSYNYQENRIEFPLMPEQLTAGEYYRLELVRRSGPTELTTGALTGLDAFMEGSGDEDVSGPNPGEENNQPVNEIEEKILYSSYFRVSTYETFEAKINAIMSQSVPSNPLTGFFHSFSTSTIEIFDALESVGKNDEEPFVSFKADFSTGQQVNEAVDWINGDVVPFLTQYQDYGCTTTPVFESLGIFTSAVELDANTTTVTSEDWKSGALNLANSTQQLSYNVERAFDEQSSNLQKDQKECLMEKARIFLLDECLGNEGNCPQYDAINNFSKALIPSAPNGSYKVKVEYRIPTVNSPTSSFDIFFVKQ